MPTKIKAEIPNIFDIDLNIFFALSFISSLILITKAGKAYPIKQANKHTTISIGLIIILSF